MDEGVIGETGSNVRVSWDTACLAPLAQRGGAKSLLGVRTEPRRRDTQ